MDVRFAVLALGDSSYSRLLRSRPERRRTAGRARWHPAACPGRLRARLRASRERVDVHGGRACSRRAGRRVQRPVVPPPEGQAARGRGIAGRQSAAQPGRAPSKEVRELTLDLGDSDLTYDVGDSLGVAPRELRRAGRRVARRPRRRPRTSRSSCLRSASCRSVSRSRQHLEIARSGRICCGSRCRKVNDRRLRRMLEPAGRGELEQWLWGRQAIDVVRGMGLRATPQSGWACSSGCSRGSTPSPPARGSAPTGAPDRVGDPLRGPTGLARQGVCSAYLADAPLGATVPRPRPAGMPHFRPPVGSRRADGS